MTEKTKIFLKKELIDIAFSVLSFVLFVGLYVGFENLMINAIHASDSYVMLFAGILLTICLSANILIQTIFNIVPVKNKIKSHIFFYALIVDTFFVVCLSLAGDTTSYTLLLFFVLLFIKFLIAKYYYKTLNKYDQNRII